MNFEDYLKAKKINAAEFARSEPSLFEDWKGEFGQMHPNSFTMQKLNLINPVRRKYPLREGTGDSQSAAPPAAPKAGRPVIKPKPKIS